MGKSTLLNAVIGQEVSITANRPQTTRNQVRGILNGEGFQAVFIDMPGVHQPQSELHHRIVGYAWQGAKEADLVVFVTEPVFGEEPHRKDQPILEQLACLSTPVFLVVNKTDQAEEERVMKTLALYNQAFQFAESFSLAAIRKKGVLKLVRAIARALPVAEPVFAEDLYTDQPERVMVAELVREQIHRRCKQEVPFGVAVQLDRFEESEKLIKIFCTILVERESHKGILIGKGGRMLKDIGQYARIKMEYLLGTRVYLDLHIKVAGDWYNHPQRLDEMGYPKP